MDNLQVSEHIAKLKEKDGIVRANAASALGKIGDTSVIPALIEALKDKDDFVRIIAAEALEKIGSPAVPAVIDALKDRDVRYCAATALGKIGDASAIPALIAALHSGDVHFSMHAAFALGQIGDSDTLPRKILADSRFSAQERINILDRLQREYYTKDISSSRYTLRYTFPETRALCQVVLNEEDAEARKGAQAVLNWLNGDRDLLRGSQPDTTNQAQILVRAAQGGASETQSETLLIAADEPEKGVEPRPTRPTIRQRLFGKRKGATS